MSITVIIGPTAIGKTDYAISIAKNHDAEIISADAFQIYQGLDIGTAKVSTAIQQQVAHHLIDICTPDQPYSVAQFMEESQKVISDLQSQHKNIIICGGTGLYLRAFLYQYTFSKSHTFDALSPSLTSLDDHALWEKLADIDPAYAEKIHPHNRRRVERALQIFHAHGQRPSEIKQLHQHQREDVFIIGLTADRSVIYDRINARVDTMIDLGLIDEVYGLLQNGYDIKCQAFQALGYQQVIEYLNGSLKKQEMIDLIKLKTRRFAKRQLTWFKQFKYVHWISQI